MSLENVFCLPTNYKQQRDLEAQVLKLQEVCSRTSVVYARGRDTQDTRNNNSTFILTAQGFKPQHSQLKAVPVLSMAVLFPNRKIVYDMQRAVRPAGDKFGQVQEAMEQYSATVVAEEECCMAVVTPAAMRQAWKLSTTVRSACSILGSPVQQCTKPHAHLLRMLKLTLLGVG